MMALTHAAISAAAVTLSLGDCSPLTLALAIAGSQIPDLDTSESFVGQIFFPISRWIEARYPHRSVTHSLVFTGAIAALSLPLYFYLGLKPWLALWLGHLVSCFSDTFTKQGVQLFWPSPAWCVRGLNPNRRLTTGGPGEYWVLAASVALLTFSFYTYSGGGFMVKASQVIGIKSGQEKLYNANAGNYHVWAQVTGVRGSDRTELSGKFWIAGQVGEEFIVSRDGDKFYKTNEQIIPSRLVVEVGQSAKTVARSLIFDDEDAIVTLQALKSAYPGAAIFFNGELDCDAAVDIKTSPDPNSYPTIKKNDALTGVKLSYHPINKAIENLDGQYVSGTLIAKVFTPSPFSSVQPGQLPGEVSQ